LTITRDADGLADIPKLVKQCVLHSKPVGVNGRIDEHGLQAVHGASAADSHIQFAEEF
jgi:hypothetical protein